MDPTRRIPVRKPLNTQARRYMVRLWEIPRTANRSVKPTQIEGFSVDAPTQGDALALAKSELRDKRRRVVRSISMRPDGVINAVLFTDERRAPRTPAVQAIRQVSTQHLRRRAQVARTAASKREASTTPPAEATRSTDKINQQRVQRSEAHTAAKIATHERSRAKPVTVDEPGEARRRQLEQQRKAQAEQLRDLTAPHEQRAQLIRQREEQAAKLGEPTTQPSSTED